MAQKYNAWSIGTAVRDPNRISPEVVAVLKDFENLDLIEIKKIKKNYTRS